MIKKFLKQIALFIPAALIGYIILLIGWGYLSPLNFNLVLYTHSNTLERMEEAKERKNVDVVVLGASHTFRSFDPRIFEQHGYEAFILGSSNQSHIQTYMLTQRYIDTLNPSVVFYETSADLFSIDGVESACDLIYNDVIDRYTIEMMQHTDLGNAKIINTFLFTDVHRLLGIDYHRNHRNPQQYVRGGFVAEPIRHYRPVAYTDSLHWKFEDKQLEYFGKVIDYLQARNIKVYLIQAPITPGFYQIHDNNKEFDSLMQRYGEYYNFNEILHLDDSTHFYDETHLNQLGADIFTNRVIEYCKSLP